MVLPRRVDDFPCDHKRGEPFEGIITKGSLELSQYDEPKAPHLFILGFRFTHGLTLPVGQAILKRKLNGTPNPANDLREIIERIAFGTLIARVVP